VFGKKQEVKVRLSRNTVSVGGQIYSLRNLARIQCWKRVPDKSKIGYRVMRPALIVLFVLVGINILLGLGLGLGLGAGGAAPELRSFNILAVLITTGVTAARFVVAVLRRPEYLLLLETNGYPIGVLSSTDKTQIDDLVRAIADAIENPPQQTRTFQLTNVVLGDQINQSGDSPVGKVAYGA
jgi:hypothetical protein